MFHVLWPYINRDTHTIADRLADYGVSRQAWPLLAAYFCVANSTLEESFWRGCLGSGSRGLETNDLMFAGYHALVLLAFTDPVWTLPVFVACAFAGWLWRRLRVTTGGLAVPITTHVIADVSIAVAVHLRAFA